MDDLSWAQQAEFWIVSCGRPILIGALALSATFSILSWLGMMLQERGWSEEQRGESSKDGTSKGSPQS